MSPGQGPSSSLRCRFFAPFSLWGWGQSSRVYNNPLYIFRIRLPGCDWLDGHRIRHLGLTAVNKQHSNGVSYQSIDRVQCCLTSVIVRELVIPSWSSRFVLGSNGRTTRKDLKKLPIILRLSSEVIEQLPTLNSKSLCCIYCQSLFRFFFLPTGISASLNAVEKSADFRGFSQFHGHKTR